MPATVNVAVVEFANVQLLFNVIVRTAVVALVPETAQPAPANPAPRVTTSDVPVTLVKFDGHIAVIVLPEPAVNPFAKSKPIVHVEVAVVCKEPAEKVTAEMVTVAEVFRAKFSLVLAVNPAEDD